MEIVLVALITAIPATIASLATWRSVAGKNASSVSQRLDRIESWQGEHTSYHKILEGFLPAWLRPDPANNVARTSPPAARRIGFTQTSVAPTTATDGAEISASIGPRPGSPGTRCAQPDL